MGCNYLGTTLSNISNLKELNLNLSNNNIMDEGAKYLMDGISKK